MADYDDLYNTTPDLQVQYDTEPDETSEDRLPNVGHAYELCGTLQQPRATVQMTHVWIHETEVPLHWVSPHVHDFDEILIWEGSDPSNPRDLGAEIIMTIEGVDRRITETGSVFIPAGTVHCPLDFVRVDRPFIFHQLALAPEYESGTRRA